MNQYTEYRVKELTIEAKTKYGDWEKFSSLTGNLIGSGTLIGLSRAITKFILKVLVVPKDK